LGYIDPRSPVYAADDGGGAALDTLLDDCSHPLGDGWLWYSLAILFLILAAAAICGGKCVSVPAFSVWRLQIVKAVEPTAAPARLAALLVSLAAR